MRRFKPILSLVLALAMVFSCFTAFAADGDGDDEEQELTTRFSDVDPNSTLGKAVTDLAMFGIITGYPDGTFGPEGNITRAEFATICVRLAKLDDALAADAVTGFPDVDADENYKWARPYILMAKNQGVINGYSDGTFQAGKTVNYAEAVKMLMCLRGWGPACEAETKANPNAQWYDSYIRNANQQGLTKNALGGQSNPTQPVNRGTVAILAYNSYDVKGLVETVDPDTGELAWRQDNGGGKGSDDNEIKSSIVRGVVTGTYLSRISSSDNDLSSNEIMVGSDVYTLSGSVSKKIDLYDILGKTVSMKYDESDDYVTSLEITSGKSTDIYSGYVGNKEKFIIGVENGRILYATDPETYKESSVTMPDDVVYNGKYIEDFDVDDLMDPDSPYFLKTGVIQIFDDSSKYEFAKITNYDTYVVKGTSSSRGKDSINFMYRTGDEYKMEFPTANSADYFIFRRGSTEIDSRSDLKQFDVLNIVRSPEDADGPDIMIIDVSRNSVTKQKVTSVSYNDNTMFEMGDRYYQYNYDYQNIPEDTNDEVPGLSRGTDGVNLYLDKIGLIAAVSVSSTSDSTGSYSYGYLLSVRQNDDKSDYDLEFYMLDMSGSTVKEAELGTGNSIQIDGKRYNTDDDDILDILEESASDVNDSYRSMGGDIENDIYQQPVRYKLNASKLVTAIDTINKSNVGGDLELSAPMNDGSTDDDGRRTYNRSSGFTYYDSEGDKAYFQVASDTKILFVPDNRADYDSYTKMTYSSFTSGNKYYVEGFNIGSTRANRADLVLVYKTNDNLVFNHTTPFLIVSDYGLDEDDEEYITGYKGSYSGGVSTTANTTVHVNYSKLPDEAKDAYNNLGRGDIVRYLAGSDGRVIDLELWLDASDPVQEQSVSDISEAIENRILAIRSNSAEPVNGDAYNAAFRLAYGTVLRIEDDIKTVTVTPTLDVDFEDNGLEMAEGGTGVVAHMYNSNTKVFIYNDSKKGAEYVSGIEAFDEISSYEDAESGASVVVTFTTGDTTSSASPFRMIYIVR